MKAKKISLTIIFLVATLIAYAVATVFCCYTTKPAIETGEFPFAITYEYKGETKTLSGVFVCTYDGSTTIHGVHERYWDEEVRYDNPAGLEYPHIIDQNEELQTSLSVQPNMMSGYFMGDPLFEDLYADEDIAYAAPYIQYYDYKNDISLNEENQDEILASIGFKVVDFTYGEPIENSFSFSGVRYEADNLFIFVMISLAFLVLCLIFVRKDKACSYRGLDRVGIVLNFLVGFLAVPFITIVCFLFGLVESDVELVNQITYNIPSVTILCLALSIAFRRKGFTKTGFFVQFGGIALFVLILMLPLFVDCL
ncbi:MAG: hypothetical protein IKU26_08205 [Clostridia bacterium]|nr:hypothetical protein [Clostridia bacterium]